MQSPPPSLRARRKAETREALIEAAFALFLERGFENTTVDEIAARADVSRSTYFRYFPSKEAVVFPFQPQRMHLFHELLRTRLPGETALQTVRRGCFRIADEFMASRQLAVLQFRIVNSSPILIARDREVDYGWEVGIAEALTAAGTDEWRARIAAAAIFGALRTTVRHWLSTGGEGDLSLLGRQAFQVLEEGFAFGDE